jgi:hypothetical protein
MALDIVPLRVLYSLPFFLRPAPMAEAVARADGAAEAEAEAEAVGGESCLPKGLVFGADCLAVSLEEEEDSSSEHSPRPKVPQLEQEGGATGGASCPEEGDSSSEDLPLAWAKEVNTAGGASCPKKVNTTGGASCPDSTTLTEFVDNIEPKEETARAAKRKLQEEWRGPTAGGSNMEKGPRAQWNKWRKDRKLHSALQKIASHEAEMNSWREADETIAREEAAWREAEHRGSG